MTPGREAVPRDVAARIAPGMRVGVDGVSAAGKTTFADELARFVRAPVVRASFDDLHRPSGERYARGEGADSYYEDTFDAARFRRELLDPFRRGGRIRTATSTTSTTGPSTPSRRARRPARCCSSTGSGCTSRSSATPSS